ncbi:hypothetical protein [Streptomyces sp. CAU 1734]|uniref:hypothetical protein n=1 Tax=Streptomyces sp. CAU 1734 TaxID=3140360 RepID=UPI003261C84E
MNSRETGPVNGPGTEQRLREAMDAVAGQVHPPPGAYHSVLGEWRRRERRRRLVLTLLTAVVFTLAVTAGVWVLNSAPARPGAPFDPSRTTSPTAPPGP